MARPMTTSTTSIHRAGRPYDWEVEVSSLDRLDLLLIEHVGDVDVEERPGGRVVVRGQVPDLAAVYGLVLRLRDAAVGWLALRFELRGSPAAGRHRGRPT